MLCCSLLVSERWDKEAKNFKGFTFGRPFFYDTDYGIFISHSPNYYIIGPSVNFVGEAAGIA